MALGLDQRPRGLDRDIAHGAQVDVLALEFELAARYARDVQEIIEQQGHVTHLPVDHTARQLPLRRVGSAALRK